MNCPSCGTKNIEDAVYCMRCGRRLDGTAECPNCKKRIPAEAEFCIYCGKNIEELAASDGSLTAVVGSQTSDGSPAARAEKESTAAAEKQALNEKARHILTLCAAACSLAMAVTALVFVFFTGVSAVSGFTHLDCDLFYYFGTAYEEIAVLFVFSLLLPAADLVQAHLFRSGRKGQKAPSENADGQN